MKWRGAGWFSIAAVLLCSLLHGAASGDELFERKTAEAERNVASIEQLTQSIVDMRVDAASRGQVLRLSCLDTELRTARKNRSLARSLRGRWHAGADESESRERSLAQLVRLQVAALVLEDEARNCASAVQVGKALEVTTTEVSRSMDSTSVTELPPSQPRLERPPLASPF